MIGLLFTLLACAHDSQRKKEDPKEDFPYSDTGTKDTNRPDDTGLAEPVCDGYQVLANDGADVCLVFDEVASSHGLTNSEDHMGLSVADINGDTWPDVYIFSYAGMNTMYLNNQGHFSDASVETNLSIGSKSYDAVFADYDDDGDSDLLLSTGEGSELYKNNGGSFSSVASPRGIHDTSAGRTAIWLGSGFLIATEDGTRFYEYTGGDSFTESTSAYGLTDYGDGAAFAAADFNGDGRLDVYLANTTGANRLFYQKTDGTFESVEASVGLTEMGNQQSTDVRSIVFDDGSLSSIYVSTWDGGNLFYINQGDGTFVDQAAELGVHDAGATTSVAWGDLGLGVGSVLFLGRWDEENLFYVPEFNEAGDVERYVEVQIPLGLNESGETVDSEWLDYDGDGDQDLLVVMYDGAIRLYENRSYAL